MENIQHVREDQTTPFRMNCLPSLEYIEALVAHYPGVEISFYNPLADIREPWLWLWAGGKTHRYYEQPIGNQLQRTIAEIFHKAQTQRIKLWNARGYNV